MNRRIVTRARHIAFDVQEAEGAGGSLFLTWTMEYRAKVGPMLVFEGVTHFRIRGGLIVEHRDYWDLLSSVVATVPGLRSLYAALTPHLA
jgi:limonene-1,2-epoxide hydrolase